MNSEFKYLFEQELISIISLLGSNDINFNKGQNELEIRFGKKMFGRFNPDIGIEQFTKIYNKYKENGENQIILDWIHRNEILNTFNNKFHKLIRRQTIKSNLDMFDDIDFDKYDHRKMISIPSKKELEMKREVKIIDLTDLSVKNQEKEKENDKNRLKFLKEGKTVFLSKTTVGNNISRRTVQNLRFTHVIENIYDFKNQKLIDLQKLLPQNIPYKNIRIKHRFTTNVDKIWRIDLTIVREAKLKWIRGLEDETEKQYQLEIEFDLENYFKLETRPNIGEMMKSLDNLIKNIFEIFGDFVISIEPMQPHTLERKDLNIISSIPYSVTDKADGERMFLYVDNFSYLKNPKTKKIEFEIQVYGDEDSELNGTIIDGEYLSNMNTFYAFDILFEKGKDIRDNNLKERLDKLKKVINILKKLFKNIKILMKDFYFEDIFAKSKEIWSDKSRFPYELDGLIYTPINEPYNVESKYPIFKWKDKHSIDVRVEPTRYFTYFHFNNTDPRSKRLWGDSSNIRIQKLQKSIIKRINNSDLSNFNRDIKHARFAMNENKGENFIKNRMLITRRLRDGGVKYYLGVNGLLNKMNNGEEIVPKYDIIEFEFDTTKRIWTPLRKRTFDKEAPNKYRTIESTLEAIFQNITIDEIGSLDLNKNMISIGKLYDLTKDTTSNRDAWRNFHNYVKSALLIKSACTSHSKRKFLLDLGTGKGGDLSKWINAGYTDILGIDPSLMESQEFIKRLKGLGYTETGNSYTLRKNRKTGESYNPPIRVTYILGDASKNLRTGEAGSNEIERQKLLEFFGNEDFNGFDTVSIMFVIHYMFMNNTFEKDRIKFEGFMKNVTENLKPDGNFIGTYMDGHRINKIVDKNNSHAFMSNSNKFYGIKLIGDSDDSKIRKYDSYWKKELRIMDIYNEVWGQGTISEPEIYSKILKILFEENKLYSVIENDSFETLYEGYLSSDIIKQKGKSLRAKDKQLSQGQKDLSFLNNVFFYKFNNSKSVKTLDHICDTDDKKELENLNKLLKELSIDEIVDNPKDFYKILHKFVNNKETSKDDLEKIAIFFEIKNTKQRIKDYIKLLK